MIVDKELMVRELAILGQAFGRKMVEEDLGIYAALIARHLDDRQWGYAFEWFTGPWKDSSERPTFMPTPQQLIDAGLQAPPPGRGLIVWGAERVTLEEYFERLDRGWAPPSPGDPDPASSGRELATTRPQPEAGPGNTWHAVLLRGASELQASRARQAWEAVRTLAAIKGMPEAETRGGVVVLATDERKAELMRRLEESGS